MARRSNMAFLAVVAVLALLQSSGAQKTITVGDSLGWAIPPNGASTYSNWAANKTFNVGDVLVFNFATGQHDATRVTKQDFDACSSTNPISSQSTGPASVTLSEAGEHYYICTVSGHCTAGQKLAVNVSAASSPAPQPSTPAPTPSGSRAPTASPPSTATPPSSKAPTATPPSSNAPTATPPSSEAPTATPPSSEAPTATPPSSSASPPGTSATPPSTATTPSSPTGGSASPPAGSSATSLHVTGLSTAFLSIVMALFY